MGKLHYQLTKAAIHLGPSSPIVQSLLRRQCRAATLRFHEGKIDVRKGERIIRISATHFPYARDMANSFDTFFGQVESFSENGYRVVDYSAPKLQTYANGLSFEIASIPEEIEAIDSYFHWYRPKDSDLIFDLGAYCGVSTYFFSRLVGSSGRVIAFEPDPINRELLTRNVKRHGLENIEILPFAIAGRGGAADFSSEGTMGSTLARQSSRASVGTVETVQTLTLSEACKRYGVPSFAKVDVEGSEIEMLESSADFLRSTDIHFALDTNHLGQRRTDFAARGRTLPAMRLRDRNLRRCRIPRHLGAPRTTSAARLKWNEDDRRSRNITPEKETSAQIRAEKPPSSASLKAFTIA